MAYSELKSGLEIVFNECLLAYDDFLGLKDLKKLKFGVLKIDSLNITKRTNKVLLTQEWIEFKRMKDFLTIHSLKKKIAMISVCL